MWVVAILCMLVGAVLAVTLRDFKRLLAYSAVAHTGFILTGVLGVQQASELADGEVTSLQAVLFYLVSYGFTMVAAFALLTVVRDPGGEAAQFVRWQGLGRRSPLVAGVFAFLLLSMAGIPLTAGFTGKFYVFRAAWDSAGPLVVIALICSAIAAFYYLRIVVLMYFAEPPENAPTIAIPGWSTTIALTFGVIVTIALGVFPQPIIDLAGKAAHFTT
jgi:NADH-quinone oxidoreductase subunit N